MWWRRCGRTHDARRLRRRRPTPQSTPPASGGRVDPGAKVSDLIDRPGEVHEPPLDAKAGRHLPPVTPALAVVAVCGVALLVLIAAAIVPGRSARQVRPATVLRSG